MIVADQAGNVSTLNDSNIITTEDTIPPSFVAAGTIYFNVIDMTFDENLVGSIADPLAFLVRVNGIQQTVQSISVSDTQVTITLDTNIPGATNITVDYIATGTSDLSDQNENKVVNFTNKIVGNNVEL